MCPSMQKMIASCLLKIANISGFHITLKDFFWVSMLLLPPVIVCPRVIADPSVPSHNE